MPSQENETPKVSRRENKKLVRAAMIESFGDSVETQDICTGTVTYTVVRLKGQSFNIAAIYGSKNPGAQSLWVKEAVWQSIDESVRDDTSVVDVGLFNRGWQWAVHTGDANDDILNVVAKAALDWGAEEQARKTERAEKAATRKANREAREAKMEAKRAAWRAEREDEPDESGK